MTASFEHAPQSLAGTLAASSFSMDESPHGLLVRLSNVPLAAALAVLAACETEEHPHVMVWTDLGRGQGQAMRVTGDTTLHHSLAIQPHWGVRVDGPIEPRDATAMIKAAAAKGVPLGVEFRATAAVRASGGGCTAWVRTSTQAMALCGEVLRRHVAACCQIDPRQIAPCENDVIETLLAGSTCLAARPLETERFPTFLDVGLSPRHTGESMPADRSVIYDVPSGTWHPSNG